LQESAGPVFVSLQISNHTSAKITRQINGLRVVQGGLFSVILLVSCLLPALAAEQSSATNEVRQVQFAERVITNELARALSPSVRDARGKCSLGCDETGAMELAIGLIGISRSDAGANALVNLLGLRLDGAGSEELSCQILTRGKSVLRRLERLRFADVVSHCQVGFIDLRKRELAQVSDVKVDQVCRSEAEIRNVRNELINAIRSRSNCE
jgi:hypothetical protein